MTRRKHITFNGESDESSKKQEPKTCNIMLHTTTSRGKQIGGPKVTWELKHLNTQNNLNLRKLIITKFVREKKKKETPKNDHVTIIMCPESETIKKEGRKKRDKETDLVKLTI